MLGACVDAPSASPSAADDNLLATSFDQLAQEQVALGDVEGGEELAWTALALREGAVPARIEVQNAGNGQVYSAFVQAARWSSPAQALRPATYRALVGWRKGGDTLQVLLVVSSADQASVEYPATLRPATPGGAIPLPHPIAHAAYFERAGLADEWIGTSGAVKLATRPAEGGCGPATSSHAPAGVACTLAQYAASFDVTFRRAQSNSAQVDDTGPTRRIAMHEQTVAGLTMVFSCVSPKSDVGCQ